MKVSLRYFVALAILTLVIFGCKKEYPRVNYISPFNRETTGFVDSDTWQQLSFGFFFPEEVIQQPQKFFFQYPLPDSFDYETLKIISDEIAQKKLKDSSIFTLQDVLETKLSELPLETIRVEQIDPTSKNIIDVKGALIYRACLAARVQSLYNWLISTGHSEKAPVTPESLTAINASYFPPRPYFFIDSDKANTELEKLLAKRKVKYEIIAGNAVPEDSLRCRMVIYYKTKDLVLKEPKLIEMTRFHD